MAEPEEQKLITKEASIQALREHFAKEGIHFGSTIDHELIEDPIDALKMGLMNIETRLQALREGFAAEVLSNVASATTALYYAGKFTGQMLDPASGPIDTWEQVQASMAVGSAACGATVAGTLWRDLQREQIQFDDLLAILYTYEQSPRLSQDYAQLIKNIHELAFELEALEKVDPHDFEYKRYMDDAKIRAEEEKDFRRRLEKSGHNLSTINPVSFASADYWQRKAKNFNEKLALTKKIVANTIRSIAGYARLGDDLSHLIKDCSKAGLDFADFHSRRKEMHGYIRYSDNHKKIMIGSREKNKDPKSSSDLSSLAEADHINIAKGETAQRTRWKAVMIYLEMWFCFLEGSQGLSRLASSGYDTFLSFKDDAVNIVSALSNSGQGLSHIFSSAAGLRAIQELCRAFSEEHNKIDSIRSLEAKEIALLRDKEILARQQALKDLQILIIQRKIKGRQPPASSQSETPSSSEHEPTNMP